MKYEAICKKTPCDTDFDMIILLATMSVFLYSAAFAEDHQPPQIGIIAD
jgi:hypothetical protein